MLLICLISASFLPLYSKFEHLEYASHIPYGDQGQFTPKEGIAIEKPEVKE